MKGKKIFRKIIVSVLVLTMVLSNVTVAADYDGEKIIENQMEETPEENEIPKEVTVDESGGETVSGDPQASQLPAEETPSAGNQESQNPDTSNPSADETLPEGETPSVNEPPSIDLPPSAEGQQPSDNQIPDGDVPNPDGGILETPVVPPEEQQPSDDQTLDGDVPDSDGEILETPVIPPEEQQPSDDQDPDENVPTEPSEEEETDEFSDLMTLEELTSLPDDVAESTMWRDFSARFSRQAAFFGLGIGGGNMDDNTQETPETEENPWSLSLYYVNQPDSYDVTKTADFNLKYQMEFHTSEDIEARDVEIRIPAELFRRRGYGADFSKPAGDSVLYSQIGVPVVNNKDEYRELNSTPFNCYVERDTETGKDMLVFFNYKEIEASTNAAWQVLYKDVKIMDAVDGTEWTLTADVKVMRKKTVLDGDGNPETEKYETSQDVPALSGRVDSSVNLTYVEKTVHTEADQAYTPGLYTKSQIEAYIGSELPKEYAEHMSDWKFVVWEVKIMGTATQPWTLELLEQPTAYIKEIDEAGNVAGTKEIFGEVVGYRNNTVSGTSYALSVDNTSFSKTEEEGIYTADVKTNCTESAWGNRFYLVTAYPSEDIKEGDTLENRLEVRLIPADSKDTKTVSLEDTASWEYENYDWSYSGDVIITKKISNPSGSTENDKDLKVYDSWLEIYQRAAEKGQDYGGIYFSSKGDMRGYGLTHVAPQIKEDGTVENNDGTIGEYKEGTYYQLIASDDLIYAYPYGNGADGKPVRLTGKDYYFDSVTITQTDTGYDVSEQTETSAPEVKGGVAEKINGVSGSLIIEAVYDSDAPDTWVQVAEIPWNESGRMVYTGSLEKDGQKPWRVRAIHNTLEYRTTCQIEVNVCLRSTSPVMSELMESYGQDEGFYVTLKNFSAALGAAYGQGEDGTSMPVIGLDKESEDYKNNYLSGDRADLNLVETAKELYGSYYGQTDVLPVLDDANATLHGLKKEAGAYKTAEYTNDADHGRVLVNYRLTAYDGYVVPDQAAADYLKRMGLDSPGKKYVMFYDLLPKGVHFDPSVSLYAGRITELDAYKDYTRRPDRWDPDQVKVSMDMKTDVIENWNQTGRTMLVFHIAYDGQDPAVYANGRWMEGWGLSFGAYYDWKDAKSVQTRWNISAFMPDVAKYKNLVNTLAGSFQPPALIGSPKEVYVDDGSVLGDGPSLYTDFYRNNEPLNAGNAGKDIRNVLYASHQINLDNADSSTSGIAMYVRADEDIFGNYSDSAYVEAGKDYTYEVTVTAPGGGLKDIVVFDHLENAAEERKDVNDPNKGRFPNGTWEGSLQSIDCADLEEMGIAPVIWYNADRYASTTYWEKQDKSLVKREAEAEPSQVLTAANGWFEAEEYIRNYQTAHASDPEYADLEENAKEEALRRAALASVGSVAVDMSKTADAQDFVLNAQDTLIFRIQMQAPEWKEDLADKNAFNNPSFYSNPAGGNGNRPQPVANSVRVGIGTGSTLEVVKSLEDEENTPSNYKNTAFEFRLYRKGSQTRPGTEEEQETEIPVANRSYTLKEWDEDAGDYVEVEKTQPHATDAYGHFYLKRGQKAVFEDMAAADVSSVLVEETPDVFWTVRKETVSSTDESGHITYIHEVINHYHPVLFVQKTTAGTPDHLTAEEQKKLAETDFTFRLSLSSGEMPVEYCYVDRAALNGSSVKIVEGSRKPDENGKYYTDENGEFTIRAGEIIALFIPDAGITYELKELKASVTETEGEGDGSKETVRDTSSDWMIDKDAAAASGTIPAGGAKTEVKNYYRWRELRLIKRITSQDESECREFFTFELRDEKGELVTGKNWYLENLDGTPVYEENTIPEGDEAAGAGERKEIGGVIGDDGQISAQCAGRVIRIEGLEAGVTYKITEVEVPELYQPVENEKSVWMPLESYTQTETFVNDYQKRPLYVTKTLVSSTQDDKSFQMIIGKKNENGTYEYGEFSYTVDGGEVQTTENGVFWLSNGQTAEFPEIGIVGDEFIVWEAADETYPQLSPILKDGESLEDINLPVGYTVKTGNYEENQVGAPGRAVLGTDSSVKFINGQPGTLILSKEYAGAEGSTSLQTQKNQSIAEAIKEQISVRGQVMDKTDKVWELRTEANPIATIAAAMNRISHMITNIEDDSGIISESLDSTFKFCISVKVQMEKIDETLYEERYQEQIISAKAIIASLGLPDSIPEGGDRYWREPAWWKNRKDAIQELESIVIGIQQSITNDIFMLQREIVELKNAYDTDSFNVMVHLTVDGQDWTPRQTDEIICIDQLGGQVYRIFYNQGQKADPDQGIWEDIAPHWSMVCLSEHSSTDGNGGEVKNGAEIFQWSEDGDFTLRPYMLYMIPLPSEDSEYTVTEINCNSSDVPYLEGFGKGYVIEQKVPAIGESIQEKVKEEPKAVVLNEVKAQEGSLIEKRMTSSMEAVPVTAELVWRVEQYDASAGIWNPAEGVEYVVKEGYAAEGRLDWFYTVSPAVERTDHSGEIRLHRSDAGANYLAVQFLWDKVYLNVDEKALQDLGDQKDGVLRVVEVPEKTDIVHWGVLAGYGTIGSGSEYGNVPYTAATAFVNSNKLIPVEIEKYVEDGDGREFTMILEQRQKDLVTNQDVYRPCAGIPYVIYDKETGRPEPEGGVTDAYGRIVLRDGQYVKLQLSSEAVWSVREDLTNRPDYKLASIGAENDAKGLLSQSAAGDRMLVNLKNPQLPAEGSEYTLTAYDVQCGVVDTGSGALVVLKEGSVTIPEYIQKDGVKRRVTGIASGAFAQCKDLTEIVIPESVVSIGTSAFEDCAGLQSVSLPAGLTRIEPSTFAGCTNLKEAEIPKAVESIDEYAFSRSGLTSVVVPENVTDLGTGAFDGCQNLETAEIQGTLGILTGRDIKISQPGEVEQYLGVFNQCFSLKTLILSGKIGEINGFDNNMNLSQTKGFLNLEHVTISGEVDQIKDYAFIMNESLKDVNMSGTVKSIGKNAFWGCKNLTGIQLSDSILSIKSNAFTSCTSLKKVELPEGLKELGGYVFNQCSALSEVTISSPVTITESVFAGCTALSKVYIHTPDTVFNRNAFKISDREISFYVSWGSDEHSEWKDRGYDWRSECFLGASKWKIIYKDGVEDSEAPGGGMLIM